MEFQRAFFARSHSESEIVRTLVKNEKISEEKGEIISSERELGEESMTTTTTTTVSGSGKENPALNIVSEQSLTPEPGNRRDLVHIVENVDVRAGTSRTVYKISKSILLADSECVYNSQYTLTYPGKIGNSNDKGKDYYKSAGRLNVKKEEFQEEGEGEEEVEDDDDFLDKSCQAPSVWFNNRKYQILSNHLLPNERMIKRTVRKRQLYRRGCGGRLRYFMERDSGWGPIQTDISDEKGDMTNGNDVKDGNFGKTDRNRGNSEKIDEMEEKSMKMDENSIPEFTNKYFVGNFDESKEKCNEAEHFDVNLVENNEDIVEIVKNESPSTKFVQYAIEADDESSGIEKSGIKKSKCKETLDASNKIASESSVGVQDSAKIAFLVPTKSINERIKDSAKMTEESVKTEPKFKRNVYDAKFGSGATEIEEDSTKNGSEPEVLAKVAEELAKNGSESENIAKVAEDLEKIVENFTKNASEPKVLAKFTEESVKNGSESEDFSKIAEEWGKIVEDSTKNGSKPKVLAEDFSKIAESEKIVEDSTKNGSEPEVLAKIAEDSTTNGSEVLVKIAEESEKIADNSTKNGPEPEILEKIAENFTKNGWEPEVLAKSAENSTKNGSEPEVLAKITEGLAKNGLESEDFAKIAEEPGKIVEDPTKNESEPEVFEKIVEDSTKNGPEPKVLAKIAENSTKNGWEPEVLAKIAEESANIFENPTKIEKEMCTKFLEQSWKSGGNVSPKIAVNPSSVNVKHAIPLECESGSDTDVSVADSLEESFSFSRVRRRRRRPRERRNVTFFVPLATTTRMTGSSASGEIPPALLAKLNARKDKLPRHSSTCCWKKPQRKSSSGNKCGRKPKTKTNKILPRKPDSLDENIKNVLLSYDSRENFGKTPIIKSANLSTKRTRSSNTGKKDEILPKISSNSPTTSSSSSSSSSLSSSHAQTGGSLRVFTKNIEKYEKITKIVRTPVTTSSLGGKSTKISREKFSAAAAKRKNSNNRGKEAADDEEEEEILTNGWINFYLSKSAATSDNRDEPVDAFKLRIRARPQREHDRKSSLPPAIRSGNSNSNKSGASDGKSNILPKIKTSSQFENQSADSNKWKFKVKEKRDARGGAETKLFVDAPIRAPNVNRKWSFTICGETGTGKVGGTENRWKYRAERMAAKREFKKYAACSNSSLATAIASTPEKKYQKFDMAVEGTAVNISTCARNVTKKSKKLPPSEN